MISVTVKSALRQKYSGRNESKSLPGCPNVVPAQYNKCTSETAWTKAVLALLPW